MDDRLPSRSTRERSRRSSKASTRQFGGARKRRQQRWAGQISGCGCANGFSMLCVPSDGATTVTAVPRATIKPSVRVCSVTTVGSLGSAYTPLPVRNRVTVCVHTDATFRLATMGCDYRSPSSGTRSRTDVTRQENTSATHVCFDVTNRCTARHRNRWQGVPGKYSTVESSTRLRSAS